MEIFCSLKVSVLCSYEVELVDIKTSSLLEDIVLYENVSLLVSLITRLQIN